ASSAASPPPKGPAERELLEAAIDESDAILEPVFRPIRYPSQGLYDYYQVVYWAASCTTCHDAMYGKYSQSAATSAGEVFDPASRPFRVVRVTMPDTEIRAAVPKTRAILLAVGILTIFLAMVALYYVV